jgi:stress response protein YsnF
MAETVIGLVEDRDTAQRVRGELAEVGCSERTIAILGKEAADNLVQELVERGYADDLARRYTDAVTHGGILVMAEADDADRALEVLNRFHKSPEELIAREGERVEEETERVQAAEEELRVGKEQTTTGKRVVTHVSEQEVEKPVTLREEEIEVERRREDRRLSPEEANQAFQERTVEVSAVREQPVVAKEAHVTEEVTLRKQASERQETVRDTVRRSEVAVEDTKKKK